MRRWLHIIIPISLLACALVLRAAEPAFIEDLRLLTFDSYQRLKPRAYRPMPVRIIDIDDESLRRLGQWPWPRKLFAELIDRLDSYGAAVIALDIVFPEPDRTSPRAFLQLWPELSALEALRAAPGSLPDPDNMLADAVARANVVTGFALTGRPNNNRPELKAGLVFAGEDAVGFVPQFGGATLSLPPIESAAAGNGSLNLVAERDNIARRVPLLGRIGEELYPSLAMEALRILQGTSSYVIKSTGGSGEMGFGQITGLNHVKIGGFIAETDAHGRVWNYDSGFIAERFIPAWRVLESDFAPEEVADNLLIIGSSAPGLKDIRATPLNPEGPGVELHAQVIEQLLTDSFLSRPDWAFGAEVAFLIGFGLILMVLLPLWGPLACAFLGAAGIALAVGLSWYAFDQQLRLFDPIYPALVVLLIYLADSLVIYLRTEAERRHVREAFAHYLAPSVVERLAEERRMPEQGGELREMTVWISDLANYSTLSEKLDAPEVVDFLNRVYTVMSDTVEEHEGFVAQFVGDAVVAAFGAPLDDPDHARHAVESAMACQARVAALGKEMTLPPGMRLAIRIGISTGPLVVGNIGSKRRLSYSIVGDDINLSSRLEGVNKIYGSTILVNEATRLLCPPELAFREVDIVRVKGRDSPVRIFEPLGSEESLSEDARDDLASFAQALTVYRARHFDQAATAFESLAARDPVAEAYLRRARAMAERPPPPDWDGVFEMPSK